MEDTSGSLAYYIISVLFVVMLLFSLLVFATTYSSSATLLFNLLGFALGASVLSVFLFIGIFYFNYVLSGFYLDFNQWVYEVEDMGFWFNRSFWIWLFAKNRKRWIRLNIIIDALFSPFFGVFVLWALYTEYVTISSILLGFAFSLAITCVFAFVFYKAQTTKLSIDRRIT